MCIYIYIYIIHIYPCSSFRKLSIADSETSPALGISAPTVGATVDPLRRSSVNI